MELCNQAGIAYSLIKDESFSMGTCYLLTDIPEEDARMVVQYVKLKFRKENFLWKPKVLPAVSLIEKYSSTIELKPS